MKRLFLLSIPLFLVACTGTDEGQVPVRLAILDDAGATLRAQDVAWNDDGSFTNAAGPQESVSNGVSLDTLPGSRRLLLTRRTALESRDANLVNASAFPATLADTTRQPCLSTTVMNAARDRVLTLSECNTEQHLALYTDSGSLLWRAALPTFNPALGSTIPTRIALTRTGSVDIAILSRAGLIRGSEVRIINANPDDPTSPVAIVGRAQDTAAIYDLAVGPDAIYAATDTGIQPLDAQGNLDATKTINAFGKTRFDRLWSNSGTGGGSTSNPWLIAAWTGTHTNTELNTLKVWNANRKDDILNLPGLPTLRDITFDSGGRLYTLMPQELRVYSDILNFSRGYDTLITTLKDARAVTWLTP